MSVAASAPATATKTVRERHPLLTGVELVALLVFIGALLWGSDYVSRTAAQSLIARAVQRDVGTPNRPVVKVRGTLFLPQVVRGRYDHVEVTVGPVRQGPLRLASVHADLWGVHLPFHNVLTRHVDQLVIDRTRERAGLLFTDLDAYLRAQGTPVIVARAGPGTLRLTGTVHILGTSVSASADVKPSFDGDALQLTPTSLATGNGTLDAISRTLLGARFTVRIPLSALPFGQTIKTLSIGERGVIVTATGRTVVVTG